MAAATRHLVRITDAQTFLFVPGDRPERFGKALASGADLVILDLEDAVAPSRKEIARGAVAEALNEAQPVLVRINATDTPWFEADLAICGHPGVAAIMLPKAEPGPLLRRVAALRPTVALIESAVGVLGLLAIATTAGVKRLGIGAIDLSLDLGMTAVNEALDPIRLQMVVASRAAGLAAPIAGVSTDFRDPARVVADSARAYSLGFGAKLCIHPAQLAPTREGFHPSAAAIARAERIIAADGASGGAAVAVDGQMIDRPVVERARRLLETAGF